MDDSKTGQYLKMRRGAAIVILLAVIALTSLIALQFTFGSQMVDDGYYYLGIARNLSNGQGFTFDGINRTNGFHPLWQMLLVPLFWIFSGNSAAAAAAVVIQSIFFTACGYLLYRLLYSLTNRFCISVGAAVFWLFNFLFWSKGALSGMETGVLLFCFGTSLIICARVLQGKSSPWTLSAALLCACMARLDTLALAAGVVLVFCILKKYRTALIAGLPIIAYLPVYMIVNRLMFGGFVPVSGYIKSSYGRGLIERFTVNGDTAFFRHGLSNITKFATLNGRLPILLVLTAAIVLVWLIVRYWKNMASVESKCILSVTFFYTFCLLMYYSFMYRSLTDIYTYYWYPAIFSIIITFFLLLSQIGRRSIRYSVLGFILTGLICFNVAYARDRLGSYSFVIPDSERPERTGVDYLNTSLDDGTIIGCWDAGYVGYYCRHRVVNLDGLVNSYEYQQMLIDPGLERYFEMENITCLANVDHYTGKREFIKSLDGWCLLFEDSTDFPAAVSLFSISSSGREYASSQTRAFYIYGRMSGQLLR